MTIPNRKKPQHPRSALSLKSVSTGSSADSCAGSSAVLRPALRSLRAELSAADSSRRATPSNAWGALSLGTSQRLINSGLSDFASALARVEPSVLSQLGPIHPHRRNASSLRRCRGAPAPRPIAEASHRCFAWMVAAASRRVGSMWLNGGASWRTGARRTFSACPQEPRQSRTAAGRAARQAQPPATIHRLNNGRTHFGE